MENQITRGCLTPKLDAMYLTEMQVRIIPYIHYCNINGQYIDELKITFEERNIIDKWVTNGDILGNPYTTKFRVSREFFNLMNIVLWEAYANK